MNAWAKQNKLTHTYVFNVVKGKNNPGPAILRVLGYEKKVVYVKKN